MPRRASVPLQQSFTYRTWGGAREGAGRKPRLDERGHRALLAHQKRETSNEHQPVHVTLQFLPHVWNLRSRRCFGIVAAALQGIARREDFSVVHYSVQGNHLHLVAETAGGRALANSVRALSIRLARGLNLLMDRSGPVLADRFHAHVLRTPAAVRNAIAYAVGNFASHSARRGERVGPAFVDRFSSASDVLPLPRVAQCELFDARPELTKPPRTWLLKHATAALQLPRAT